MAYHFFQARDTDFERIFDLMADAFPPTEMRPKTVFLKLFKERSNYKIYCIGDEQKNSNLIAFIVVWELENSIFIENFAVDSSCRGKGFGGLLLDWIVEKYALPVYLEVEPPLDLMTKRRVGFYESHGFLLCPLDYLMPPLRPGDGFLPLKLMSRPGVIAEQDFDKIRKMIYRMVYDRP